MMLVFRSISLEFEGGKSRVEAEVSREWEGAAEQNSGVAPLHTSDREAG